MTLINIFLMAKIYIIHKVKMLEVSFVPFIYYAPQNSQLQHLHVRLGSCLDRYSHLTPTQQQVYLVSKSEKSKGVSTSNILNLESLSRLDRLAFSFLSASTIDSYYSLKHDKY